MFPSKNVKVSSLLYYEVKKYYFEHLKDKIGFVKFCDLVFRLGYQSLKQLPENEILQLMKAEGG